MEYSNVTIMDHPLIHHKLTVLRDEKTSSRDFRALVSEIAMLMCYEATRDLPLEETEVKTPVAVAKVKNQMTDFVTKKGDLLIVRALKIDWATFEENTLLSGKRVTTRPIKIEIMDTEELKNRLNNS